MQTNLMCIPQGPVVQNFVSLTLSLSHFVNYISTSKALQQRILTFYFPTKITIVFVILPFDILTNRYR